MPSHRLQVMRELRRGFVDQRIRRFLVVLVPAGWASNVYKIPVKEVVRLSASWSPDRYSSMSGFGIHDGTNWGYLLYPPRT